MPAKSFMQLDVWKKADEVTNLIYDITEGFPKHQLFSMTSQMQRSAYSVPANIAEGFGRMYPKDKARIYNIAFASTEELKYFLHPLETARVSKGRPFTGPPRRRCQPDAPQSDQCHPKKCGDHPRLGVNRKIRVLGDPSGSGRQRLSWSIPTVFVASGLFARDRSRGRRSPGGAEMRVRSTQSIRGHLHHVRSPIDNQRRRRRFPPGLE